MGSRGFISGGVSHAAKQGAPTCPICSTPTVAKYRPFCSRRCADVDLSRWLRGAYAIPGQLEGDEDGDDTAAAHGRLPQNERQDPGEDR